MISFNNVNTEENEETLYEVEASLVKCKLYGISLDLNNNNLWFFRDLLYENKRLLKQINKAKRTNVSVYIDENTFLDSVETLLHFEECATRVLFWSIETVFGKIDLINSGKIKKLIESYIDLLCQLATDGSQDQKDLIINFVEGIVSIRNSEDLWKTLQK